MKDFLYYHWKLILAVAAGLGIGIVVAIITFSGTEVTQPKYTYLKSETVRIDVPISDGDIIGITRYEELINYTTDWKDNIRTEGVYRIKENRRDALTAFAKVLLDYGYRYVYSTETNSWVYIKDEKSVEFLRDAKAYAYIKIVGEVSRSR